MPTFLLLNENIRFWRLNGTEVRALSICKAMIPRKTYVKLILILSDLGANTSLIFGELKRSKWKEAKVANKESGRRREIECAGSQ